MKFELSIVLALFFLPLRFERNLPTNAQAKMLSIETLHQSNDHRYKLSSNVFASTRNKDSCFCPKESHDSTIRICPPTGTLNVSACNFGTPMIASFPHFYTGNESLFEKIVGLEPRQERHESYIDLHPVNIQLLNILLLQKILKEWNLLIAIILLEKDIFNFFFRIILNF